MINNFAICDKTASFLDNFLKNINGTFALDVGYGQGRSFDVLSKYMTTISLENDPKFSKFRAIELLSKKDEFEEYKWYKDLDIWTIPVYDFVFVDGPVGFIGRYGAVPELEKNGCVHQNTIIVLDDCFRDQEKSIAKKWCDRYKYEHIVLNVGRGMFVLCKNKDKIKNCGDFIR